MSLIRIDQKKVAETKLITRIQDLVSFGICNFMTVLSLKETLRN